MVKLQAIIGKFRGKMAGIDKADITSILTSPGWLLDAKATDDSSLRNPSFELIDRPMRNLYVSASLNNVQEFYFYLSQNGFCILDSKIQYS